MAEARTEAKRILAERTLGKHQAPRQSFKEALDAFLAHHEANNRPGTHGEVKRILNKQFTPLHRHRLSELKTHDITKITDKMVDMGYPSAANHAHMAIRSFLHWCVRPRLISHSPLEGLEKPAPTLSRERVLSDDELRTAWRAADELGGTFGIIVKLLVLTGQRRGEIGQLKKEWIGENTITIPAEVSKNRRAHTFPVGALTASLAQPISFNGWSKAKAQLDKRVSSGLAGNLQVDPLSVRRKRCARATWRRPRAL